MRFPISLLALFTATSLLAQTSPKPAQPGDPSDLTPVKKKQELALPPSEESAIIRPLKDGELPLKVWKKSAGSDAPNMDHLPVGEDALKLQIFLDESNFGPGIIDGKPGRFTVLAVEAWNESKGYKLRDLAPVLAQAKTKVTSALAMATVPAFAPKWVDPTLPDTPELQSKRKMMSYRSLAEFMSERFHTSVDYLLEINGPRIIDNLKPGSPIIVPNVKPFLIEKIIGVRYEKDPQLSDRCAVVDTNLNQVKIYDSAPPAILVEEDENGNESEHIQPNKGLIAAFPITPGEKRFIHYGVWELRSCVELPVWRYDKSLLETGKRGSESLNVPSGPNSPVGVIWNGLSRPGIGMHGTGTPDTIGRARSHGCIRMANWDAIRIPTLLRPGAVVELR
jgi:lipoprotein-anchoring transpeptidase ErfK/SrfK